MPKKLPENRNLHHALFHFLLVMSIQLQESLNNNQSSNYVDQNLYSYSYEAMCLQSFDFLHLQLHFLQFLSQELQNILTYRDSTSIYSYSVGPEIEQTLRLEIELEVKEIE